MKRNSTIESLLGVNDLVAKSTSNFLERTHYSFFCSTINSEHILAIQASLHFFDLLIHLGRQSRIDIPFSRCLRRLHRDDLWLACWHVARQSSSSSISSNSALLLLSSILHLSSACIETFSSSGKLHYSDILAPITERAGWCWKVESSWANFERKAALFCIGSYACTSKNVSLRQNRYAGEGCIVLIYSTPTQESPLCSRREIEEICKYSLSLEGAKPAKRWGVTAGRQDLLRFSFSSADPVPVPAKGRMGMAMESAVGGRYR